MAFENPIPAASGTFVAPGPVEQPARVDELLKFVRAISRQEAGLLKIVSQIAPAGGQHVEDLALLDVGDPGQRLLLVMQPTPDEFIVFRRLYSAAQDQGPVEQGTAFHAISADSRKFDLQSAPPKRPLTAPRP